MAQLQDLGLAFVHGLMLAISDSMHLAGLVTQQGWPWNLQKARGVGMRAEDESKSPGCTSKEEFDITI